MKIPFRPLSLEVRALFTTDFSRNLKTGDLYKTELVNSNSLVMTTKGHREVRNHLVKVYTGFESYMSLTIPEFIENFQVPEVPSLETVNPVLHLRYQELVNTVYEMYGLTKYDFQLNDLGLLLMKDQAVLSYEQGLGKSICGLVWARIKRLFDSSIQRVLYIVQQDLIMQWKEEGCRVGINLRRLDKDNIELSDTGNYVTHYEFMRKYYRNYYNSFQMIILDEAHKIKSGDALRGIAIRSLESKYKLCLSGTPIKNIVSDLHFLLGWLYGFKSEMYPYAQNEQSKFRKDFGVYEIIDGKRRLIPKVSNIQELQLMLAPAILRRDINDTGVNIVKRNSYLIAVEFTAEQHLAYKQIQVSGLDQTSRDYRLRLNCAIFPDNNKIKALEKIVIARLSKGEQVIIGTGLVPAGQRYEQMFKNKSRLVNGDVSPGRREKIINDFKCGVFPILIVGIEAVNSGHSLQNCNNVVVTDYPWTASTLDQLCGRVRRIVSTKDINIFMLYTKGSYDERNLELIGQKRDSSENVLDGDNDFEYTEIEWSQL